MRIDSERPRKTPRGVILGTSVGMTTSDVHMDVQPRFGKSSILNQLCVPSMSAESTEHALATKHLLIAMGSRRATPNFHRLDCINTPGMKSTFGATTASSVFNPPTLCLGSHCTRSSWPPGGVLCPSGVRPGLLRAVVNTPIRSYCTRLAPGCSRPALDCSRD